MRITTMALLRQGDVLLVSVDRLPDDAVPVPPDAAGGRQRHVLAEGERDGHAHTLSAEGVTLYRGPAAGAASFIEVRANQRLDHPEHRSLDVPAGIYRVALQRTYQPTSTAAIQRAD